MIESVSKSDEVLGKVAEELKEVRASEVKGLVRRRPRHRVEGQAPLFKIRAAQQGASGVVAVWRACSEGHRKLGGLTQPPT